MKLEYFTDKEIKGLTHEMVVKLILARRKTLEIDPDKKGIPFRITSGYRSPEKNLSVIGAVPDSAHIKGLAADMRVTSSREVAVIVQACFEVGINRIGIYINDAGEPIHLHLDIDREKISHVLFVKKEQN